MPEPLLNVRDLSHCFERRSSAELVRTQIHFGSFAVNSGSTLLIRGVSGCGKSTLLHLLAGVLPINVGCGSVILGGVAVERLSGAARDQLRPHQVGWMPQRQFLINSLSVIENLWLPLSLAGTLDDAARARAEILLAAVAIPDLAYQRPATLSVGQAARVCLARALLANPRLLLADEPTAALDETSSRLVAQQIGRFTAAGGAAIVASHDPQLRSWLAADGVTGFSELELTQ